MPRTMHKTRDYVDVLGLDVVGDRFIHDHYATV